MKLKRKILYLAIVMCALISVFAVSAFASTDSAEAPEPSLNFEAANLSFEDSVYVLYAVSHEGISAENVKLLFWTEAKENIDAYVIGTESYAKTYVEDNDTVNNKSCVIFKNNELRAKNMTDYVYARAYANVDGVEYYSEVSKYSILQYAYNMLGYTAEESENTALKNMLVSMLQYGADAQVYANYNTERLANKQYYQVNVDGGTLEDGFSKGLYHAEETAVLTAPEKDGFTFVGWKNAAGEIVSTDNPARLTDFTSNDTYTSVYNELNYSKGLKYTLSDDETYYIVSGIGTCTDTDIVIPKTYNDLPVKEIGHAAFYYCDNLTGVTIPNSVTSIGDFAFCGCNTLTNITISDNVTSIGDSVFYSCTSLTSITIPDSVTSIMGDAFNGCDSITNIIIPNGVEFIDRQAFSNCSSLRSVTIGNGIASIGDVAFFGCSNLKEVHISDIVVWCNISFGGASANPLYYADNLYINGNIISGDFAIPDGVKAIPDYTFKNSNITSLIIPDSVTSIGSWAFSSCDSLASVTIGNGVTSISDGAFHACGSLKEVHISDIGAWCNISFVDSYVNPLRYANHLYLDGNIISGDFVIPDGVKAIPDYTFKNSDITSITIPDSVTSIGYSAFYDCRSLTSVRIGNGVTSIGSWAFANCESLTSITIPDGVTSISNSAFQTCTGLTSVTIGNNVTSIGNGAFSGCSSLTEVHISDIAAWCNISFDNCYTNHANPLYYAKDLYLNENLVTELVIPDTVTEIKDYAFYYCTSLTSVTIHDGVTSIGGDAFDYCSSLKEVHISNMEAWCNISFGNEYANPLTYAKNLYLNGNLVTELVIPDTVTEIKAHAFYNCTSLTSVTIGNSITSIGEYAFYYCTSLTSVTIPDSVTSIDANAFYYCTSLTNISVSENNGCYKSIDGNLYSKDSKSLIQYAIGKNDGNFIIPDGVTSIGDYAFAGCYRLTSVTIPDSVTSIGNDAFQGCRSLTSVYYTETAEEWAKISIEFYNSPLTDATKYYYSEEEPTEEGNFWYYDENGEVAVW